MSTTTPATQPGFDIRHLTEDQRALSEDIASSMVYGHADGCAVWLENDPDGCSCELLQSVAGALHDVGVVEIVQEVGWDSTTRRGDRLIRRTFDPHPAQASQLSEAKAAELVEALRWLLAEYDPLEHDRSLDRFRALAATDASAPDAEREE